MPKKKLTPWTDLKARKKAILEILARMQKDFAFRCYCLASPEYVRRVFVEEFGLDVPGDAIVSFVPEGDRDNHIKNNSGSLVFEVPPPDANSPAQLMDYVRCTYVQWRRKRSRRGGKRSAKKSTQRSR